MWVLVGGQNKRNFCAICLVLNERAKGFVSAFESKVLRHGLGSVNNGEAWYNLKLYLQAKEPDVMAVVKLTDVEV
jgi:hypothetical protein